MSVLQREIDLLVATGAAWGLKINADICVVLRFDLRHSSLIVPGDFPSKVNDCNIKFFEYHSDLDALFCLHLAFHVHVRRVAAVAAGLKANSLECTLCRDFDYLVNFYVTYVRQKIEYGCQLWIVDYVRDMKLLERIQRKWARAISGMADTFYDEHLRHLDLFSVNCRLLKSDLVYV